MTLYNFASLLRLHTSFMQPKGKYLYHVNVAFAAHVAREFLLGFVSAAKVESLIASFLLPVRPSQHKPRNMRVKHLLRVYVLVNPSLAFSLRDGFFWRIILMRLRLYRGARRAQQAWERRNGPRMGVTQPTWGSVRRQACRPVRQPAYGSLSFQSCHNRDQRLSGKQRRESEAQCRY